MSEVIEIGVNNADQEECSDRTCEEMSHSEVGHMDNHVGSSIAILQELRG